ncbi:MAG: hypothetical protein ACQKBY_11645, partial [Verrucomicrobiales bacterium]
RELEQLAATLPLPADCELAVLALEPQSGDILAILGERSPLAHGFNHALDARRGLGPLIEPFLHTCAREAHRLPLPDNLPATGRQIGEEKALSLLKRFGLSGPFGSGDDLYRGTLSTTPLELATAAATLANHGRRPHTRFITHIEADAQRIFTGPTEHYPAFSANSCALTELSPFYHGQSPGKLDFWALSLSRERVIVFWAGFDQPQAFSLTPDAINIIRQTLTR